MKDKLDSTKPLSDFREGTRRCKKELTAFAERLMPMLKAAAEAVKAWISGIPPELVEAALKEVSMRLSRQAVMRVSRELLERLLPNWQTVARLRFGEPVDSRLSTSEKVDELSAPFHEALKLPLNCRITGISTFLLFEKDEVAFRIESPDFMETAFGCRFPDVQAVYRNKYEFNFELTDEVQLKSATGYFLCWEGPAVETRRIYGPDCQKACVGPPVVNVKAARDGPSTQATHDPDGLPLGPLENDSASWPAAGRDPVLDHALANVESHRGLPVHVEDGASSCWRCSGPTLRKLPDGTAECQNCSEKSLL